MITESVVKLIDQLAKLPGIGRKSAERITYHILRVSKPEALALAEKEWPRVGGVDLNYRGKGLQLEFTVEDAGVFTMPWSATITYGRDAKPWEERICAENIEHEYALHVFSDPNSHTPTVDKPDF